MGFLLGEVNVVVSCLPRSKPQCNNNILKFVDQCIKKTNESDISDCLHCESGEEFHLWPNISGGDWLKCRIPVAPRSLW